MEKSQTQQLDSKRLKKILDLTKEQYETANHDKATADAELEDIAYLEEKLDNLNKTENNKPNGK